MKNPIDNILTEWAYRVHDGMPDPKNQYHLVQLQESMKYLKVESEVIDMVMNHLYEAKPHKYIKKTGSKGNYVYTYPSDGAGRQKGKEEPKKDVKGSEEKGGDKKSVEVQAKVNKEVLDKISKEKDPKKKEALKAEYIANQLDSMLRVSSIDSGAGRYDMSREDVIAYRKYLTKIMGNPDEPGKTIDNIKEERRKKYGEITDEDIINFIESLEFTSKSGDPDLVTNIKTKIKGKGGPGSTYTTGEKGAERYINVIRAYLETGGISPITGQHVPFSECQLDHIVSLGNQGKDVPDNWMFMEERFNQYKGKKTDEDIRADLERDFYLTDAEIAAGEESTEVSNALKAEDRAFWKKKFEKSKGSDNPREIGVTINQLNKMNKTELGNFIYGWNLANPDNELSRYETQKIDFGGKRLDYARGEGNANPVQPKEDDKGTWGLVVKDTKDKDGKLVKTVSKDPNINTYEDALKAYKDNRASGGREKSKEQFIEMIVEEKLASDSTEMDELFADKIQEHRTGQLKRDKAIKAKVKDAKDSPGSMEQKKKIVTNSLKDWEKEKGNQEPHKDVPSKNRKKTPAWQAWKKDRDTYEYKQWVKFANQGKN